MKYKLQWNSEEEGVLVFFEEETIWLCFDVFLLGEEAELVIKYGEIVGKAEQLEKIGGKLLEKVEKCMEKAFSLLWKKGIEEVFLVEKQEEPLIKALKEENKIELVYSEYMMKRSFFTEDVCQEAMILNIRKEEDTIVCENEEKSFFCRLLPYEEKDSFYLYEVEVVENLRNQGIATNCLKQLFSDLVQKNGEVTIYLQVGSYNEPALHLYQKLGFELSEEICYNTISE